MLLHLLVALILLRMTAAQNCFLQVPAEALTATGLSTPYHLSGTGCDETNTDGSVFVEATIFTPSTGALRIYSPLVVNAADPVPAVPPTVPSIASGDVVALFFGANTDTLTLTAASASTLMAANCVNGLPGSVFDQVAFCNAVPFFSAVNAAISEKKLAVPEPGVGSSGFPCPTVRSFSVVDQDQSDNVITSYLIVTTASGHVRLAQKTAANRAAYPNAIVNDNGSDNALLGEHILPALGCVEWRVVDVSDPSGQTTRGSQALNEIQANSWARPPIAYIPAGDEMVQVNGASNLQKINAYRTSVDQMPAPTVEDASTGLYCARLLINGLPTLLLERHLTDAQPSVDPAAATNLFTFLMQRFAASYTLLNCANIIDIHQPVDVITNSAGVATGVKVFGWPTVLD